MSWPWVIATHDNIFRMNLALLLAGAVLAAATTNAPLPPMADAAPTTPRWISRQWEFRYILRVDRPFTFLTAEEYFKKPQTSERKQPRSFEGAFGTTATIQVRPDAPNNDGAVSIQVIEFDPYGLVRTSSMTGRKLTVQISSDFDIYFSGGPGPDDPLMRVAHLEVDPHGDETEYMPAICSDVDMNARYKRAFKASGAAGNFGCREWGYQLRNNDYPYIDITSHQKEGARIRPIIGWGRFDVAPKPVIGKFENTWLCLHECPDGARPGVIPDIKAWADKRDWPLPDKPKRQPMFPDAH